MNSEEPVTLFPVPTKLVERLIELYSKVYTEDLNEYKKNTEACDWCKKYFKKYTIKCSQCKTPFINCQDCFNVSRFQCHGVCCNIFICKKCKETHNHSTN